MNIDFSGHPGFSLYIVLLAISGALMVGIGTTAFSGQSTGWRIFNVVAGSAFFGYAFYLAFLFEGGTYIIFLKAFILPALMLINAIRSAVARGNSSAPQQTGWPDPQQAGWAGPEQPTWAGPQQTSGPGGQQAGWPGPQQTGPQQAGWVGPQQTGGPGQQQGDGAVAPQQAGWPNPK